MEQFNGCFEDLEDPRDDNARHDLLEVLVIALCTVLCGGTDCTDMALFGRSKEAFLRQFLYLRHGIPSHDTFSRVFRLLDPVKFHACFLRFMQQFGQTTQGVVAIDGKTLRHSFDRAAGASALHLISAWAADQRLVLGQLAVDDKSNEITAVPKLLEMLSLKGTIVTVDALNCQRDIAQQIVDQGGDYVLALKGNQGMLHADVSLFLDDPQAAVDGAHRAVDGDHGRIETRTSTVSSDIAWLQERHAWPGLAAIGKIVRTREIGAKITTQTAYYLLSAPLSAERFGEIARHHWGIENRLHWVLDVTMNEDQTRNRKDHGPENLALLRRLALNLARLDPSKGSMKGKLKRAGWDNTFLTQLLTQFANPQMQ
jgi:predicted transposase YbfD/YdcC